MPFIFSFFLALFLVFEISLNSLENKAYCHRAEKLFNELLYQDAIPFYEKAVLDVENNDPLFQQFLQSRLCECYLELGEPKAALAVLSNQTQSSSYLKAVAHRQLKNYAESIRILQNENMTSEVAFELGLNYLFIKNYPQAQLYFENVVQLKAQEDLTVLAQLHLARISLLQEAPSRAKSYLKNLDIIPYPSLQAEWSFLSGITAAMDQQYEKAIGYFEESMKSQTNPSSTVSIFIAYCLIENAKLSRQPQELLDRAEQLLTAHKNNISVSDLVRFYLIKGRLLDSIQDLDKAKESLSSMDQKNLELEFFLGQCAWEKGLYFQKKDRPEEAIHFFLEAEYCFKNATSSLIPKQSALALKYLALALYAQGKSEQVLAVFDQLLQNPTLLSSLNRPQQIYYFSSLIPQDTTQLEDRLKQGIAYAPDSSEAESLYKILGLLYLRQNRVILANEIFEKMTQNFPNSIHQPEIRFLLSQTLNNEEKKRDQLQYLYIHYPNSSYAPLAHFSYYSYEEYLQGNRKAIKHLLSFPKLFPQSPLILNAYYLIGLYHSKDHISQEGKMIRHRNLTAAIEAFQGVENEFDQSFASINPAPPDFDYYERLHYKSILEKGRANLLIAEESRETKRQIYLDYAEKVFSQLSDNIMNRQDAFYATLLDESQYELAHVLMNLGKEESAEELFAEINDRYRAKSTEKSYLQSRVLFEMGLIALNRENYENALKNFINSEKMAVGLSNDQTLELWIKQSYCCQKLNRLEQAMVLLSKVINEDVVSGLRIEAMLLRADLYDAQGRTELARKQLRAVMKKGGKWALLAKEREEKRYGNL